MKTCEEYREQISPYIDNELDEKSLIEFEDHINACIDCRKELHEINAVVNLCLNTSDEDLPDGFSVNLHKVLIYENQKMIGRSKRIRTFGKYAGVFSSAAAVMLIAYMCWGIWFNVRIHNTSSKESSLTDSIEEKSNTDEVKERGTSNKFAVQDKAGNSIDSTIGTNNDSLTQDSENSTYQYNTQVYEEPENGIQGFGRAVPSDKANNSQDNSDGGIKAQENTISTVTTSEDITTKNTENSEGTENNSPLPINGGYKATSFDKSADLVAGNTTVKSSIEISLYESNPSIRIDEIKKLVSDCEGEFLTSVSKPELEAPQIGSNNTENVINLKMTDSQFAKFIDLIKSGYDPLKIVVGDIKRVDVTQSINELKNTLSLLDYKISLVKSGEVPANDLQSLKSQREQVNREIENYENDSMYVFITIKIFNK